MRWLEMESRIGVLRIPYGKGLRFLPGILGDMMDDYYTHRRFGNNYMRENLKRSIHKGMLQRFSLIGRSVTCRI